MRGEHIVHRLMQQGVDRRWFHSACLLAAVDGQPVIHRAYGRGRLDMVYDLASLTKPLAATTVTMRLAAQGALRVGQRVRQWIPELRDPRARSMRIWHLLAHSSGLPAWLPLYEEVSGFAPSRRRQAIRRRASAAPLEACPGRRTLYSDLGFILLDQLLHRCAGAPLDILMHRLVCRPLCLGRTLFLPLKNRQTREELLSCWPFAPTERCPWRGRRLKAEVHDDNCHAMGGVSGHAGLFSTAHEVHLLARELTAAFHGRPSLFDPQVVRRFLSWPRAPGSTRVLGWDTPDPQGSSTGRGFGPDSVGHLGFTGTSLWIDLRRSLWVVLLTNRVYYGREPNPMPAFRPRLHDAVLKCLER